jgi:hypothetical protein
LEKISSEITDKRCPCEAKIPAGRTMTPVTPKKKINISARNSFQANEPYNLFYYFISCISNVFVTKNFASEFTIIFCFWRLPKQLWLLS